jgi:hypothetical protein
MLVEMKVILITYCPIILNVPNVVEQKHFRFSIINLPKSNMLNGYKPNIKVGGSYALFEEGQYTLQILDVNPEMSSYQGVDKPVLNYKFAILDDVKDEDGQDARGRFLWKRCSESMNSKSWLYKLASSTLGKDLTDEEAASFDAESLIGKQVSAFVEQKTKQDNTGKYNNILKFSKVKKQLETVEYVAKPESVERESKPINIDVEVDNIIEKINE